MMENTLAEKKLVNNIRDKDMVIYASGIQIVIDEALIDFLEGTPIDFVSDVRQGKGFVVYNPNILKAPEARAYNN